MSIPREPQPGKPLLSVLAQDGWWQSGWEEVRQTLVARFGPVDYESRLLAFDHTSYYEAELGAPLFRRILGFERLVPLDGLRDLKLRTNELERQFSRPDGARRVNLDPGLITLERLVLATGKNFTHRVYLGSGIWADLTLIFNKRQGWVVLPWTFPDYATEDMKRRLTALRDLYKTTIEAGEFQPCKGEQPCPSA